jgi:two-component system response regulator RegX3
MTRVLVVEDEQSLREPLVYLLQKEGYDVVEAEDGSQAVKVFEEFGADMILLDLMLPGMSGNEVCRHIRATSQVPIIMLTAKDSEIDKVVGLEIGADDYVTKPYSTRELLARMKAVLRRHADTPVVHETPGILEVGSVRMDVDRHLVFVHGEKVSMPLKEFELLELLLENANRVLTRGQIIDRVWGSNYFGDTKTLDVHIKRIRSKIEDDPARPEHLLTVRGLGYKYEV